MSVAALKPQWPSALVGSLRQVTEGACSGQERRTWLPMRPRNSPPHMWYWGPVQPGNSSRKADGKWPFMDLSSAFQWAWQCGRDESLLQIQHQRCFNLEKTSLSPFPVADFVRRQKTENYLWSSQRFSPKMAGLSLGTRIAGSLRLAFIRRQDVKSCKTWEQAAEQSAATLCSKINHQRPTIFGTLCQEPNIKHWSPAEEEGRPLLLAQCPQLVGCRTLSFFFYYLYIKSNLS